MCSCTGWRWGTGWICCCLAIDCLTPEGHRLRASRRCRDCRPCNDWSHSAGCHSAGGVHRCAGSLADLGMLWGGGDGSQVGFRVGRYLQVCLCGYRYLCLFTEWQEQTNLLRIWFLCQIEKSKQPLRSEVFIIFRLAKDCATEESGGSKAQCSEPLFK